MHLPWAGCVGARGAGIKHQYIRVLTGLCNQRFCCKPVFFLSDEDVAVGGR